MVVLPQPQVGFVHFRVFFDRSHASSVGTQPRTLQRPFLSDVMVSVRGLSSYQSLSFATRRGLQPVNPVLGVQPQR